MAYIEGLSNHSQDRLAQRYGIDTYKQLKHFAELCFGQENVHWFPADVGPQRDDSIHGRMVPWETEHTRYEIVCAVGKHPITGRLAVITVLSENGQVVADYPGEDSQSPSELAAQNKALSQAVTRLEEENAALRAQVAELQGVQDNLFLTRAELENARSMLNFQKSQVEEYAALQKGLTLLRGLLFPKGGL